MYTKPLMWYMTGRYKVTDLLNTSIRVFTLYVQIFPSSPLSVIFRKIHSQEGYRHGTIVFTVAAVPALL